MRILASAKAFTINLLVFAFLFALAEVGIRVARPGETPYQRTNCHEHDDRPIPADAWYRKSTDLGWILAESTSLNFAYQGAYNREATYARNPQGFRCAMAFDSLPDSTTKTRVMLLGDSFMFGIFLDETDAIHARLTRSLGDTHEFYNCAIPGWGIDQMYLCYEKYAPILQPSIVVLMYVENSVVRVLEAFRKDEGLNKPSFDVVGGKLVQRTCNAVSVFERLLQTDRVLNVFYKRYMQAQATKISSLALLEIAKHCNAQDRRFIAYHVPLKRHVAAGKTPKRYAMPEITKTRELLPAVLTMPPGKRESLYLENDPHLSAKGAGVVAGEIAKAITE